MSLRDDLSDRQRRQLMHDRFILLSRKRDLSERDLFILDTWGKRYPVLTEAHSLKEAFFDLFDISDRAEAEKQYGEWCNEIGSDVRFAFDPIVATVGNWYSEVFAYFDHRATNAYTESLNSLTRVINRVGRGYSFEVLRAKMLYFNGIGVVRRPLYGSEFHSYHPSLIFLHLSMLWEFLSRY